MKISIITPSYNQWEFLQRTIDSVIIQSGNFELEYIVMDWGSSDESLQIIKDTEKKLRDWNIKIKCSKINFIRKSEKDKWQSDAINKWLKIATWDILAYLNSDDTYEPWTLQKIVNNLWNSDKKWCYWKCKIIDKEDKEIRKWITIYKNILWRKYSYFKLLSENFISQMTVFWKREVTQELWYFDINEHLCMDYEYWLRIWQKYDPLYISKYIANFRFYNTSKSWSKFIKQFTKELIIAKKYADWKYKFSLLLHKFNYYKIVLLYKILKILNL